MPNIFSGEGGGRKALENNLPSGDENAAVTREQFAAMGYAQRLKIQRIKAFKARDF